jgi:hypothetical protein
VIRSLIEDDEWHSASTIIDTPAGRVPGTSRVALFLADVEGNVFTFTLELS